MKVSREQAAQNRERIVEVASRLFREKGFDGIGVADLMKGAGLTHGGFYGHFASKEDLLAEACEKAMQNSVAHWQRVIAAAPDDPLGAVTARYLSEEHRDHPSLGCAVTALAADVARVGPEVRQAMTDGALAQIDILAGLEPDGTPDERRRKAIARYAAMIGGVVLARAVADPALGQEILASVAASLQA